jgi:hypothetical protein
VRGGLRALASSQPDVGISPKAYKKHGVIRTVTYFEQENAVIVWITFSMFGNRFGLQGG